MTASAEIAVRPDRPVFRRHRREPWILVSLLIVAVVALADVTVARDAALISALSLGPLVAAIRLSPRATGLLSGYAMIVGLALGAPDEVLMTGTHALHLTVVAAAAVLAVLAARARVRATSTMQRTAVQYAVAQALFESPTLAAATPRILEEIARTFDWELAVLWRLGRHGDRLLCVEAWAHPKLDAREFIAQSRRHLLEPGQGLPGRTWQAQKTLWISGVGRQDGMLRVSAAVKAGLSSAIAFPIYGASGFLGVLEFWTRSAPEPDDDLLELMRALGQQIGSFIERKSAEEVARDIDARKSAVLESALDAIITIDSQGRILEFNPAAEQMFGYTSEEVQGCQMSRMIVPPSLRSAHDEGFKRYLAGGEKRILDTRRRTLAMRKDGSEFPVELAVKQIEIAGPPMFTAYLRDITQQVNAEQELSAAEERFRSAFALAPIGVALVSLDGRFLQANGALCDILGYSEDELRELTTADITHLGDLAAEPQALRKLLRGSASVQFEKRYLRKDGNAVLTQVSSNLVRDRDGQPVHLVTQIQDITARREAEEELKAREARFRAVFDSANDAMVILDNHRRFLNANPAALALYGLPIDELRRHTTDDFDDGTRDSDWGRLEADGRAEVDTQIRRLDGSLVEVAASVTANFLPGRHLVIMRDVTARKREERYDRFLAEASKTLASSLDFETTLRKVTTAAVPDVVDWCAVDLVDGSRIDHVAVAHADPRKLEIAQELRRRWATDPDSNQGVANVIRTGEPEMISRITDEMLEAEIRDPEQLELLRQVGMVSVMMVPMTVRGKTIGAMTFVSAESGRIFDEVDLALAQEVAIRCAIAVDNARLFSDRDHQARTLQASLLPPQLPEIPGLELAARYHALGEGNEVGGDFYDVFQMPDRRWALVMGDVCGKGPEAAALTALTRYTIRAVADGSIPPSQVLSRLNEAILRQNHDGFRFCTAAVAFLQPSAHGGFDVELALGGHPQPLKVHADGSVSGVGAVGMLLGGLPEAEAADEHMQLHAGEMLVFYTDGVSERRIGGHMVMADRKLETTVQENSSKHAEEVAEAVVRDALAQQDGHATDDIAVMVLRMPASEVCVHQRFVSSHESVALARQAVMQLRGRSAAVNWSDVSLMVSELTSNAVRHTDGEWFEMTVELSSRRLRVEVVNPGAPFQPSDQPPAIDAPGGRGLWLVSVLADRWGVSGDTHTTVWLECDL